MITKSSTYYAVGGGEASRCDTNFGRHRQFRKSESPWNRINNRLVRAVHIYFFKTTYIFLKVQKNIKPFANRNYKWAF